MRGVWLDPERTEITTLDRMIVLRGKRVIFAGILSTTRIVHVPSVRAFAE